MTIEEPCLLTMIKPDGFTRTCTPVQQGAVRAAWADVLAWLNGADPDDLTHAAVVAKVAQKAALRMIRFPEYNIATWSQQASRNIPPQHAASPDESLPFTDLLANLLQPMGFTEEARLTAWLNRVAIEMLYGDAPMFQANRELLVPLLLKGPVIIQRWHGPHRELALAAKHTLRFRFSLSDSNLTNLIHMEPMTRAEHEMIERSLQDEVDA